jgi:quercetin dioxygenase-like cupin family protein
MADQPAYAAQNHEVIFQTADVRVIEIALAPGFDTPEHHHTEVDEICYCLTGELTVETTGEPPETLLPGQRRRLSSGAPHRLRNLGSGACRFLLIHGVGRFDFVATKPARRQMP